MLEPFLFLFYRIPPFPVSAAFCLHVDGERPFLITLLSAIRDAKGPLADRFSHALFRDPFHTPDAFLWEPHLGGRAGSREKYNTKGSLYLYMRLYDRKTTLV